MNTLPPGTKLPRLSTSREAKRRKEWRDFGLGIITNIILNLAIARLFIFNGFYPNIDNPTIENAFGTIVIALPWVINIVAIVVAIVKSHSPFALGFLAFYVIAFALVLITGIFYVIYCFANGA